MIAIKDMKMPSYCGKCNFKEFNGNDDFYHCTRIIGYPIIVDREKYLDNCPLVDIITCKDCKYYRNSLEHCIQWCMSTTDDFYCGFAERRE